MSPERARVAITGTGAVTPLGNGARALYERWRDGVCGLHDGAGRCPDFDPVAVMGRTEARRTDRFTQMAMAAAHEAIAEAGWSGLPYDAERISCVVGTGAGGAQTQHRQFRVLFDTGEDCVSPFTVPMQMVNAAGAAISIAYGLRGQLFAVTSACASAGNAIGVGMRMIQWGDADAVVVGGSDTGVEPLMMAAFRNMDALSDLGLSRPFDARRDGFVIAEGAGVLVLENLERARQRGATVLAELSGYGSTSDAHHISAPEPTGTMASKAIAAALRDAGREPEEVDYVNAHGTSTPLNDRTETLALKNALGERAYEIPVSSTKSAIGHLLGAAPAVEAIATVHALRERVAPPTLGYEVPDPELDLDYVPDSARPLAEPGDRPLVAISNSFGFGGHNTVLCLEAA
jgi:3-oxoacyl-[acyl-carrier-protein] synthase II